MNSSGEPPRGRAADPTLSFIVTCKGRLAHLRQSLRGLMAQPQTEVIVVDYDCPDGAAEWVEKEWPAARVVRVANAPVFNLARSRNAGAREALAQWLCFSDADNVLGADYARRVSALLEPGAFYWNDNAPGHIVCARADFLAIEGYDEVLEGWGQEDMDFQLRLALLGRTRRLLPPKLVTVIAHGNEERTRYYRNKQHMVNNLVNGLYCQVKRDLMLEKGQVNLRLERRRKLYGEARAAVARAARGRQLQGVITVELPEHTVRFNQGWRIERAWRYVLKRSSSATIAAPPPRRGLRAPEPPRDD